jgi:hypothetical protein
MTGNTLWIGVSLFFKKQIQTNNNNNNNKNPSPSFSPSTKSRVMLKTVSQEILRWYGRALAYNQGAGFI